MSTTNYNLCRIAATTVMAPLRITRVQCAHNKQNDRVIGTKANCNPDNRLIRSSNHLIQRKKQLVQPGMHNV